MESRKQKDLSEVQEAEAEKIHRKVHIDLGGIIFFGVMLIAFMVWSWLK
jgi:formate-dependent phosphoribosylglycinamide formyltransferase (GAR transformylase)